MEELRLFIKALEERNDVRGESLKSLKHCVYTKIVLKHLFINNKEIIENLKKLLR